MIKAYINLKILAFLPPNNHWVLTLIIIIKDSVNNVSNYIPCLVLDELIDKVSEIKKLNVLFIKIAFG